MTDIIRASEWWQFRELPTLQAAPVAEYDYLAELEDLAESVLIALEYSNVFDKHLMPWHWLDSDEPITNGADLEEFDSSFAAAWRAA